MRGAEDASRPSAVTRLKGSNEGRLRDLDAPRSRSGTDLCHRRGFRDNLAKYVPTAAGHGPEALGGALERFAQERHLPDRGRGILENCIITRHFPVD
jgi:hypothetical protein